MIVYLVAAAQALVYVAAVPLHLAFCLQTRGGLRFGAGVSAFERRFALRSARRRLARRKRRRPKSGKKPPFGLLMKMLRRLRLEGFTLRGRLNLGDAAATALACGALRSLEAGLHGAVPGVRLRVTPDFSDVPCAELQGMIRARTGQIIYAAARGGLDDANGRIAQWINTRLKT